MRKRLAFIFLFLIASGNLFAQDLKIYSFGQELPGKDPRIFAPGIISLENRIEGRGSFSPDGKFLFFIRLDKGQKSDIWWVDINTIKDFEKYVISTCFIKM